MSEDTTREEEESEEDAYRSQTARLLAFSRAPQDEDTTDVAAVDDWIQTKAALLEAGAQRRCQSVFKPVTAIRPEKIKTAAEARVRPLFQETKRLLHHTHEEHKDDGHSLSFREVSQALLKGQRTLNSAQVISQTLTEKMVNAKMRKMLTGVTDSAETAEGLINGFGSILPTLTDSLENANLDCRGDGGSLLHPMQEFCDQQRGLVDKLQVSHLKLNRQVQQTKAFVARSTLEARNALRNDVNATTNHAQQTLWTLVTMHQDFDAFMALLVEFGADASITSRFDHLVPPHTMYTLIKLAKLFTHANHSTQDLEAAVTLMLRKYNMDPSEFYDEMRQFVGGGRPTASVRKGLNMSQELEVISETRSKGSKEKGKEKGFLNYRNTIANRTLMTFGDMKDPTEGDEDYDASYDRAKFDAARAQVSSSDSQGQNGLPSVQKPRNAALNMMTMNMPKEYRTRTRDAERPWSEARKVRPTRAEDNFRPAVGVRMSKHSILPEVGGRSAWSARGGASFNASLNVGASSGSSNAFSEHLVTKRPSRQRKGYVARLWNSKYASVVAVPLTIGGKPDEKLDVEDVDAASPGHEGKM
eukprot:gnl/MRDRNA2_/MRDRNA2_69749_c0_seq1.p1 gnl/MRDRNA2_/MRDRNA2_69749_c0~~gnl/MRDRNA2_/MRDRNA2_69749_c0_seq1.p1  ORF type:complete len:586 (-),score=93.00 gnl/MRDRNA2_/MRDRNA2_69749_c0_seq1:42-1799(-)